MARKFFAACIAALMICFAVPATAQLPGTFSPLLIGPNKYNFYQIIQNAGLTTNLEAVLDAGASGSYPGTGTSWSDLSSTSSPWTLSGSGGAFNGSAGALTSSEYFSTGGSAYFAYSAAATTWMNSLHKNGAVFTIIAVVKASSTYSYVGATRDNGGSPLGMYFGLVSGPQIVVSNGTGNSLNKTASTTLSTGAWHFVALSLNENGGNVSFFYLDGNYDQVSASNTFDANYSSPSSSNANGPLGLWAFEDGASPAASGNQIAAWAVWSGTALTKANLDTLYAALQPRFGF